MAISAFGLHLLAQIQQDMVPLSRQRLVLAFGYPDILASPEQIRQLFGDDMFRRITFRPDSAKVIQWHKAEDTTDQIVETTSLFAAQGMQLEVSDIAEARGGEFVLDLNYPCNPALHGRYDLLVDSGTLKHCFNIGQTARNMARMVGVGGTSGMATR